jgi:hypothetical protein
MSAYYEKFRISKRLIIIEMIGAVLTSSIWLLIRDNLIQVIWGELEPMLVGLAFALLIHIYGLLFKFSFLNQR